MKKRPISYTVSLKNPLTWLALLQALLAAVGFVLRLWYFRNADFWMRCFLSILPGLGGIYFAYQLAFHGKERIYRLSMPFWLIVGTVFFWGREFSAELFIVPAIGLAWTVHRVLKGSWGSKWLLALPIGLTISFFMMCNPPSNSFIDGSFQQLGRSLWMDFAETMLLAAYVPLLLVLRKQKDGNYHPTWGDRYDGRRLRSLSPISAVATYIMPERNQANVFFPDKLEITELEKYIRAKRAEGYEQFGMTEALLAAFVRTVSKYPGINRFISGERIYAREDDIQFCMTVKKEMTKESPDTVIKVHLKPGDGVAEVYRKFHETVNDAKKSMELDSSLDGVIALVGLIPGVLLKFVVWLLKLLDYFGLLPRFILEVSPFHASIFFTSMGSLGIPAVYHHLYNFGNLPIFLAFGRKYRVNELDDDGKVVFRKYIDYTYNVDERIVDGFYYATAIKYFHKLLLHPERLDEPDMEINRDIP